MEVAVLVAVAVGVGVWVGVGVGVLVEVTDNVIVDEGVIVGVNVSVSTNKGAPCPGIDVTARLPETSNRNIKINIELTHFIGFIGKLIISGLLRVISLPGIPTRIQPGAGVLRFRIDRGALSLYLFQVHQKRAM